MPMKIQFNPDLDYQADAINSIIQVFAGQEVCNSSFSVSPLVGQLGLEQTNTGVGNRLRLLPEEVLENTKSIQLRNGLKPSETLEGMQFSVEMETGTGKTYVYLRTIFELNKLYGFTKFIIVVPSVAIKEGVHKALQMTDEHFRSLYESNPCDYFVYDVKELGQVRNFATASSIQVMVINIDAFRKSFTDPEAEGKANLFHRWSDRLQAVPRDLVQATNPIVIIDEPQSVDRTPKSKEAIASLRPLCTLRYSATHVEKHNMMYRLDSVDAYQRKLVKQIEVSSVRAESAHNDAYIRLLKVDNSRGAVKAQVEIDVLHTDGSVRRVVKTVKKGHDLFDASGGRGVYEGFIINEIWCVPGEEYIDFTSNERMVPLHGAIGDVDQEAFKRLQIKKTIEKHLDKELRLQPLGIKVLSLFFIDRVSNYRDFDDEGNAKPGKYAQVFEEEYRSIISRQKYHTLLEGVDLDTAVELVHDGYFALDKRGGKTVWKDSSGEGRSIADESAYELIMKDKERLLSFDSPLKFIWSHSALKEGWDNPNVFQICTLNETASVMKKRQEIGRGMRICVDQDGERVHGFDVNTLTVIANESYADFAAALQKEIEEDEGIRFGIIEPHYFANIAVENATGGFDFFGASASQGVWDHFHSVGYIDNRGRIQESLRKDLRSGELSLPDGHEEVESLIAAAARRVAGNLNIRNADDRKQAKLNKAVYLSSEFSELWNRIKYKTTFSVDFMEEELIAQCVKAIDGPGFVVGAPRFRVDTALFDIDRSGVQAKEVDESAAVLYSSTHPLPDIVSFLQVETSLTRRTIVAILTRCSRLSDFQKNPQKFIEEVTKTIKGVMQNLIVDGIKYRRIGDDQFWAMERFVDDELFGYFERNMLATSKSVFDHVIYDSDVECEFARRFERSDEVKVYAKLPSWFKIDTPLGAYNPDWAVLVERDDQQRLYFVVETKGATLFTSLRPAEAAKIKCGEKHFLALETGVKYGLADGYDKFAEQALS